MEFDKVGPKIEHFSETVIDEDGESKVYLTIIEFTNAIQASLYDNEPKLGSMVLGYKLIDQIEKQVIFAGKHDQLASALAMLLARRLKKITYASVNLTEQSRVTLENIRFLVEKYVSSI